MPQGNRGTLLRWYARLLDGSVVVIQRRTRREAREAVKRIYRVTACAIYPAPSPWLEKLPLAENLTANVALAEQE